MTYYDWQITHSEVMSRDNPDKPNSNTPEGLESRFSVGIRRILAELPHSTKLELRKLH
jgi:hypothetical protein